MSEEETNLFIQDIERCSHCLQHYNIEKELKAFSGQPGGKKMLLRNLAGQHHAADQ